MCFSIPNNIKCTIPNNKASHLDLRSHRHLRCLLLSTLPFTQENKTWHVLCFLHCLRRQVFLPGQVLLGKFQGLLTVDPKGYMDLMKTSLPQPPLNKLKCENVSYQMTPLLI